MFVAHKKYVLEYVYKITRFSNVASKKKKTSHGEEQYPRAIYSATP